MRKIIPFMICVMMIISMLSVPTGAASSVLEFSDFTDGTLIVLWDRILVDSGYAGVDPISYLEDYNAVGGPASTVGVSGWTATNSQEIVSLGYMIDGGDPVMSEECKVDTDNAVIQAANNAGCEYVTRYQIRANVEGLEGNHEIEFLIGLEDGTIVKMSTQLGVPIAFTYSADGSAVAATPEPTQEPDPSEQDNTPGPIFRFNDEDIYAGLFTGNPSQIESIEYDSEKKCFVISMDEVGDPYSMMALSALAAEDDAYEVDADTYRILQIGVRFPTAAGTRGQFYFQTSEYAGIDEAKDVIFDYNQTDELQYVNINLGSNKRWTGTMADCRFDPLSKCDVACEYEFYYMAFFTNVNAANEFGDSWLANGDAAIPTPAPTPTKAPTPEPTATPEAVVTDEPAETPAVTDAPAATVAPAATDKPGDDTKDSSKANTGLIIAIVAIVAVVAAAAAGIVIGSKKKKK